VEAEPLRDCHERRSDTGAESDALFTFTFTARYTAHNELSQRLVRYCSVEDATLEGAVCCSLINNVHTLTTYVSQCAEIFAAHVKSVTEQ